MFYRGSMKKKRVVLPGLHPQSREGQKINFAVQPIVLPVKKAHWAVAPLPEKCPALHLAPGGVILQHCPISSSALETLVRIPGARGKAQVKSPTLAEGIKILQAGLPAFSSYTTTEQGHLQAKPLCSLSIYLSFLSPGGTQLYHTLLRDAHMLMKTICSLSLKAQFEHWFCKQQAILTLQRHLKSVFVQSRVPSRKDFLLYSSL